MLVLRNLRIVLSNVGKNMSTTECGKIMVKCDVSTAQCDNRAIKCEKKIKGITECDKRTVTCDVGTA